MPAHDLLGQRPTSAGEPDAAVDVDEVLVLEPLDHLGDRRARDPHPFRDPCLDDIDVVLGQLVDGLAVLLERGMPFCGVPLGHGRSL